MISLMDVRWKIVIPVIISALIFYVQGGFDGIPEGTSGFFHIISKIFSSASIAAIIILIIGKSTHFCQLIYKIKGAQNLMKIPNLNGVWIGPQLSSYQIARKNREPIMLTLVIRQSFLEITINSISHDGRTTGDCLGVIARVDNGRPSILSFYRSIVTSPKIDDPIHHGFRIMHINPIGTEITGTYASDRGYQYADPSSGSFLLRRFSHDPGADVNIIARTEFYRSNHWPSEPRKAGSMD